MAHFAELDENNIVKRVIVVGNDVPTANGPLGENDMHVDGETYCKKLFGGNWKQTSYHGNFRGTYAGKGFSFDVSKNKFIPPQPYPSWSLNAQDRWEAPISRPSIQSYNDNGVDTPYTISWSEENLRWEGIDNNQQNNYWDPNTSTWILIS